MPDGTTSRRSLQMLLTACCIVSLLNTSNVALGQETPPPKPPRIALVSPLSVPTGQKTRVVLRGWLLKDSAAVMADHDEVRITVVSHAAAAVPGKQKSEQIGDEQLELDVEVPAEFAASEVRLRVRTAAGESPVHRLPIDSSSTVVAEQEPNDGFRQPQQISVPQLVVGSIHADSNVDVFAFELSQPAKLRLHVEAAALGSNLDSVLTLWATAGTIVAINDDRMPGDLSDEVTGLPVNVRQRDSLLQLDLPAGRYLLTVQDAFDRGGPAHPFRLHVQQVLDTGMMPDAKP